jgi:hypothetical protein
MNVDFMRWSEELERDGMLLAESPFASSFEILDVGPIWRTAPSIVATHPLLRRIRALDEGLRQMGPTSMRLSLPPCGEAR